MRGRHGVVAGVRQPIFVETGRSGRDRPRGDLRHNWGLHSLYAALDSNLFDKYGVKVEFVSIRGSA